MRRFLLVTTIAAGVWSTHAAAQMPTGSYVQSCRDLRFDGYTLSAVCNAMQGPPQRTSIRVDSCPGPIGNYNGQLFCEGGGQRGGRDGRYGRGEPGYGGGPPPYDRRGGYDRDDDWRGPPGGPRYRDTDRRYDGPPGGYGRPGPGGPPPGAPPAPPLQARPVAPPPAAAPMGLPAGSWAASCSGGSMQGTVLVAACRDAMGNLHQAQIDVRACKSVANQNGRLVCG